MSAAAGWHPDPAGRHQFRWWDGARWSDRVCGGNVVGDDPLPGAAGGAVGPAGHGTGSGVTPSPRAAEILAHTGVGFQAVGRDDWHQIVDLQGQPLARLWRSGADAVVCDLDGAPVMGCNARRSRDGVRTGGGHEPVIIGVGVTDALGAPWMGSSRVTAVGIDLTATFKQGGERLLQLKVDRTGFQGRFSSALVLDGNKRRIGGVRTYPGPDGTEWWGADRDPTLGDPLATLAFMAPFLARCLIQIG